ETFLREVNEFVARLLDADRCNSLALTLLKLATPGVPDFYQGTELWALSLVDPDNRRPVDFEQRMRLFEQLRHVRDVMSQADAGAPRLWLIAHALRARREYPSAFGGEADHMPLPVKGDKAAHAIAFLRAGQVAALAPRLPLRL